MLIYQFAGIGIGAALPQEYYTALASASQQLQIPAAWLDRLIYRESGYKLFADNGLGYYGLGQWGTAAAQELGYRNGKDLVTQNPTYTAQMQVFVKWIKLLWSRYGKVNTPGFLYLCHFLPASAKYYSNKSYILYNPESKQQAIKGNALYDRNTSLDTNKDGKITVSDIDAIFADITGGVPEGLPGAGTGSGNQYLDVLKQAVPLVAVGFIFMGVSSLFND